MRIIGTLQGADVVLGKLKTQLAHLQNLDVPLLQSGVVVRDAAVQRIKDQGGDQHWIPNKRGGHTGILTGRMMGSIAVGRPEGSSISVSTNVPYARYFQEGTGIFAGHRPWKVTAKSGKMLRFVAGGKVFFRRSVTIPGQPPRPFLLIGEAQRERIFAIFSAWLNAA